MSESQKVRAEKFSAGYDLIHGVNVIEHQGEEAIMDHELFYALEQTYGRNFMARVGDCHYLLKPQASIPEDSVAIPADSYDDSDSFLIKR